MATRQPIMKHKRAIDFFLLAVVAFSFAWIVGFTGQPAWGTEVDEDAVEEKGMHGRMIIE